MPIQQCYWWEYLHAVGFLFTSKIVGSIDADIICYIVRNKKNRPSEMGGRPNGDRGYQPKPTSPLAKRMPKNYFLKYR